MVVTGICTAFFGLLINVHCEYKFVDTCTMYVQFSESQCYNENNNDIYKKKKKTKNLRILVIFTPDQYISNNLFSQLLVLMGEKTDPACKKNIKLYKRFVALDTSFLGFSIRC